MKLQGSITLSFPRGGDDGKRATIVIRDRTSGVRFCEAELDLLDFAEMMSGLAEIPCELDLHRLDAVGMTRENKTLAYDRSVLGEWDDRMQNLAKAVASDEVDGWEADVRGALSTKQPSDCVRVRFTRYVKAEPATEAE